MYLWLTFSFKYCFSHSVNIGLLARQWQRLNFFITSSGCTSFNFFVSQVQKEMGAEEQENSSEEHRIIQFLAKSHFHTISTSKKWNWDAVYLIYPPNHCLHFMSSLNHSNQNWCYIPIVMNTGPKWKWANMFCGGKTVLFIYIFILFIYLY